MSDVPEIARSYIDVRHARLAYESQLTNMQQWQLDELKNFMLQNGYREEGFPHRSADMCRMRWDEKDADCWVAFPRIVGKGSGLLVDFILTHLEQRRLL